MLLLLIDFSFLQWVILYYFSVCLKFIMVKINILNTFKILNTDLLSIGLVLWSNDNEFILTVSLGLPENLMVGHLNLGLSYECHGSTNLIFIVHHQYLHRF